MKNEPRVDIDVSMENPDEPLDKSAIDFLAPPEQLHSDDADELESPESDQPPPEGSPTPKEGPQRSPADIESKFEQRIRETEEKLASQFASLIDRVNKSNRDATRARFEQLKERVDELYHVQAAGLDELVAAGKLNATDAAVQKLQWRDKYERQALAQAKQLSKQPPSASVDPTIAQALSARVDWETRKRDILQVLDLTGAEPEYSLVMALWNPERAQDVESAASQFRALAKQVRQRVDARVQGSRRVEGAPAKKPPLIESGGDGAPHAFDAQSELRQLIEKGPPNDPRRATRYLKRLEELEASLD